MKHKHTKGPWKVGGKTGFINQLAIEPSIGTAYGAGEELQANARLIAAAPDLLEALEALLEGNPSVVAKARAAVAKAKGE